MPEPVVLAAPYSFRKTLWKGLKMLGAIAFYAVVEALTDQGTAQGVVGATAAGGVVVAATMLRNWLKNRNRG